MSFVFSGVQVASFAAAAFCTLVLPVVLLIVLAVMKKIRLAPLTLGFVSFFVSQMVLRIPLLQLLNAAGALNAIAANTVLYAVVVGGLSAGLFEETARLGGAAILKNYRTWKDMVSFGIPLFANIHLCGSVLTEVFFCMTISKILYGHLPSIGTMILFCALLGIFAIGAPGVPGGTVMASLGLITGVLMFDDAGTALMLAIFALQDSFGTACNVTGDGALTLMLTGYAEKHGIQNNDNLQTPIL